ncbi:MAG: N-acetyltransferase family protein [Bacteroidota bacterium]
MRNSHKPRSISIERAGPEDYERIANIYNEYVLLGNATMEESLYDAQKIESWSQKFNDREGLYVLRKGSEVIGWGIIKRYSDRQGYRFACETAIYLTQSELRKGYGSLIKQFLIEECKRLDYHHLVAKIFAVNQASIEYNLKIGYTIVGRQKEIGFKNGEWMDIVIMQYIIESN